MKLNHGFEAELCVTVSVCCGCYFCHMYKVRDRSLFRGGGWGEGWCKCREAMFKFSCWPSHLWSTVFPLPYPLPFVPPFFSLHKNHWSSPCLHQPLPPPQIMSGSLQITLKILPRKMWRGRGEWKKIPNFGWGCTFIYYTNQLFFLSLQVMVELCPSSRSLCLILWQECRCHQLAFHCLPPLLFIVWLGGGLDSGCPWIKNRGRS